MFGLPGNPVSSLVTFYLLGCAGHSQAGRLGGPERCAACAPAWRSRCRLTPSGPSTIVPCYTGMPLRMAGQGGFVAASTGNQASSRLLSMRSANALLELPAGSGVLPQGAPVDALLIGDL